jgi:DNA primase
MIPDEVVERVKEAADIVQIIGEYVQLRRTGADWRGPCPFHQGTHRNFSVSPSRGIYYCFVCHEGGDVFQFLRKRLGVEWPEAVKMIASRYGIDVPESGARREGPDPREPFWELNATAAEYFTKMLWEDRAGSEARAYLERRQIDRAAADRFGLGFAPREVGLLRNHMNALGFDEARLLDGGLLVKREESAEPRPRFTNRLIFPIHDLSGHVVAFGGRLLGAGEPKYLNSSDSAVFSKGRLLYGLHTAKNIARKEERIIVVEGYFDAIRLVLCGFENVVAPLGTALTEEQAALIARYVKEVLLFYDSDSAGLRATFRAGDVLLAQGLSVQVATLPEGDDPDSFGARAGRAGLLELFGASTDVFERRVKLLEQKGWFRDIARRRRAVDHLLPTIRATRDPLTRDLYVSRASTAVGVGKEAVQREVELNGARPRSSRDNAGVSADSSVPGGRVQPAARGGPTMRRKIRGQSAERAILAALLQLPSKLEAVAERIGASDFWVPEYRAIFEQLIENGGEVDLEALERELPAGAAALLQDLVDHGRSLTDIVRTIDDAVRRVESRALERELNVIERQIRVATEQEKAVLMRDTMGIQERLLRLGGGSWRVGRYKP